MINKSTDVRSWPKPFVVRGWNGSILQREDVCPLCVCRKSIERKTSQEKRERDRDHSEDAKKKEKEKVTKEETTKRSEKEVKKTDPVVVKKPEPSVSPKKLQVPALPITRHRVSFRGVVGTNVTFTWSFCIWCIRKSLQCYIRWHLSIGGALLMIYPVFLLCDYI